MEQCAHVASSIRMSDKLRASSETWTRACYFVCCTHITTAENEIVYGVKEPQGRPLDPHSLCKGQLYNEPERERDALFISAPSSTSFHDSHVSAQHIIPPRILILMMKGMRLLLVNNRGRLQMGFQILIATSKQAVPINY